MENWRWEGVPFLLRSGKALGDDVEHVAIVFREVPHLTFGQQDPPEPNRLLLGLSRIAWSCRWRSTAPGTSSTSSR